MNLVFGENIVESITPTVEEFRLEDVEVIQLRTPQPSASPTEGSPKVASKESSDQSTVITASSIVGVLLIAAVVYRMREVKMVNSVVPSLPPQQEPVLAAVVPGVVEESIPKEEEPPAADVDKEMILEPDKKDEIVETPDLDMMESGQDGYISLSSDTEEQEQQPEAQAISADPPNLEEMESGNQNKVVFGQISSSSDSLWTSSSDAKEEMVLEIPNETEPQEAKSLISLSSDTEDKEVLNGEDEAEKLDDFLAELASTTEEDISSSASLSL
jgi:hypothetical protein